MTGGGPGDYARCMTRDGGQGPETRPLRRQDPGQRQLSAVSALPTRAPGGPARAAAAARQPAHPRRPSLGGGAPAQGRALGRQGQRTVRKLLEAGLAEFDENGFQVSRVDDVVRRANISHGTFYLYFSNKEDLFRTLLRDTLADMSVIIDEFPVVTRNESGRTALRDWVGRFCDIYADHATVLRILAQAEVVGEEVYSEGFRELFRLAEAITQGMTAGLKAAPPAADGSGLLSEHAELTAVACLMMLERVNFVLSVDVRLPREEMIGRLTAIIYAAFQPS
jgi:AcrR family transcriptional regulator